MSSSASSSSSNPMTGGGGADAPGKPPQAAQFEGDELWDPSWKESDGEATIRKRSSSANHDGDAKDDAPVVILYTSWFCPFAQRAWIALVESGVPYKYVEVNPYQVDPTTKGGYTKKSIPLTEKKRLNPEFVAASPRGLVPGIDHDGKYVWESMHVSEYVDTVFNQSKLLPTENPHKKAMIRIWADHCTDRIQKAYYTALMCQEGHGQKVALETFFEECRALANAMSEDGPYFAGNEFSMVDVALAPFYQRFILVGGYYRNLTFPQEEKEFKRLDVWWQAVKSRPSVKATFVCEARLIASYRDYERNVATSDFAKGMTM